MHKIGSGIIPHSAAVQTQGSIPQKRGLDSGDANINGHGVHMKAMKGDAVPMSAQEFVTPRGAVAADDVDLRVASTQAGAQVVQQIEHARIVMVNRSGAVIPQVKIKRCERFGNVMVALAIQEVEMLACVSVKEPQMIERRGGQDRRLMSWNSAQAKGNQTSEF